MTSKADMRSLLNEMVSIDGGEVDESYGGGHYNPGPSYKEKLVTMVSDGMLDANEAVQGMANWLGDNGCREFMEEYLGIDPDEA